jgi:hypothetical protein
MRRLVLGVLALAICVAGLYGYMSPRAGTELPAADRSGGTRPRPGRRFRPSSFSGAIALKGDAMLR